MHLPEHVLGSRGLGRLSRLLGMGVDLTQGKVPVNEAQLATQLALHSLDDMVGNAAVGAFIVGVLDHRHQRSVPALNVIPSCDWRLQITCWHLAGQRVVSLHGSSLLFRARCWLTIAGCIHPWL